MITLHKKTVLVSCFAVVASILTAACTQVVQTSLYEYATDGGTDRPLNCHSSLGAYYLPRTYVHVKVSQVIVGGKVAENRIDQLETITRADTKRMFCLDYLASAFADDQISVKKTSASEKIGSQLLMTIASNSVDQTSLILRTIIKTIFTGISGFRVSVVGTEANPVVEPVGEFEFDPFDQAQSAIVNDRLSKFGFCLVLEHYTYGKSTAMSNRYCGNPIGFMQEQTTFARDYSEFNASSIEPRTSGVVYRPRASFQLSIFGRDDPQSRDPWLLRRTMSMQFENISPVLSIGVDRALFTLKQIALIFDKGALYNACVMKKSEAVEAIKIPLEIVKGIASLPTEFLKVDYDNISKSQALSKAEFDLINAQKQLIAVQRDNTQKQATNPSSNPIKPPDAFGIPAGYSDPSAPILPSEALAFSDSCKARSGK